MRHSNLSLLWWSLRTCQVAILKNSRKQKKEALQRNFQQLDNSICHNYRDIASIIPVQSADLNKKKGEQIYYKTWKRLVQRNRHCFSNSETWSGWSRMQTHWSTANIRKMKANAVFLKSHISLLNWRIYSTPMMSACLK